MGIQRIDSFLTAIHSANESTIADLCSRELVYLRTEYNVQSVANDKGIFPGLATFKRAITNYRKAVHLSSPSNIAMQYLNLNEDEKKNFYLQNTKASYRNMDSELWAIHEIKDTDGFIQTSVELLQANSYVDNILGLAALTGRRIGEIGFYSDFELISQDEFDAEYGKFNMEGCDGLKVLNLSKKQTYKMAAKSVNAIIPVLYDSKIILDAFKDLRKRKVFESHDRFHNAANKDLSKKVKKYYEPFLGSCACHDLRKAYARIVFDYLADLPNEAMAIVISKILVQSIPANYLKFSSS